MTIGKNFEFERSAKIFPALRFQNFFLLSLCWIYYVNSFYEHNFISWLILTCVLARICIWVLCCMHNSSQISFSMGYIYAASIHLFLIKQVIPNNLFVLLLLLWAARVMQLCIYIRSVRRGKRNAKSQTIQENLVTSFWLSIAKNIL